MAKLRDCVNGDSTATPAVVPNPHNNVEFKLAPPAPATSITLTGQWMPIGYWRSDTDKAPFNGTFDGDHKTISGLNVLNEGAATNNSSLGLFGYVGEDGEVKNLRVQGTVVRINVDDTTGIGGIVGRNDGTVQGCSFSGAVQGPYYVGGVVGNNSGTVSECFNAGDIIGNRANGSSVGGVVGHNGNADQPGSAGKVLKCYNTGDITNTGSSTGGVVGRNFGSSKVEECYNTGHVAGPQFVGGVVGSNFSTGTEVKNCYNTGNVTRHATVNDSTTSASRGGVVGGNAGTVLYSYSHCEIVGIFNVGGVVGWNVRANYAGKVENCVSLTWMVNGNGPADGETVPSVLTNVGRVVGRNFSTGGSPVYGTLANNKARADMELRIRGVNHAGDMDPEEVKHDKRHGADVKTDESEEGADSLGDVFDGWAALVGEDSKPIWKFKEEDLLETGVQLPILANLDDGNQRFRTQNPRLPGHPHPGSPGESNDGGCGCDTSGFAASGLLMLAFMAGIKRLRLPRG